MRVLVTGATGYIGGRIIPKLIEQGHAVRVLVRDPGRIARRSWTNNVEIVRGDLVQGTGIAEALNGIDAAYYLVHSMLSGGDFQDLDRKAARNFVAAAQGLKHAIYLGGLVPQGGPASEHLASRSEVGRILGQGLPATEFRAGPIIGSGSASFEMLRYLTERLPVMIAPKWIRNEIQPIAIRDVLSYLVAALQVGPSGIVDIGADRLTFKDMMKTFAEIRGLHRAIFPVPVLAPGLASRWVGLVTPIPNSIAVPIIEGIIQPLLANTSRAEQLFPDIKPIPYRKAVELALNRLQTGETETRWSNALGRSDSYELKTEQGMIREVRTLAVRAPAASLFKSFSSLGGQRGWLAWNWAWEVRGLADRVIGGPGLRRGRRDAKIAFPGEAVDFWRVEAIEPDRLLRLRAEMKVPGRAWLEWQISDHPDGSMLTQIATFAPKGLAGLLYWYSLYPIHGLIFSHLAQAIARDAEKMTQ